MCNYEAEAGNSTGKRLQQLIDRLRGQQLPSAEGIVVSKHSLMMFVGKGAKTSTKVHVDWTQAKNVALSLRPTRLVRWLLISLMFWVLGCEQRSSLTSLLALQAVYQNILAVWVFVPPDKAEAFAAWARQKQLSTVEEGLHLTLEQVDELRGAVPGVVVLRQCAGDLITVPAGWMHAVINRADACKLAFDCFEVDKFHLYAQSWRQIASKYTKTSQADDYMQACAVLRTEILQRVTHHHAGLC